MDVKYGVRLRSIAVVSLFQKHQCPLSVSHKTVGFGNKVLLVKTY